MDLQSTNEIHKIAWVPTEDETNVFLANRCDFYIRKSGWATALHFQFVANCKQMAQTMSMQINEVNPCRPQHEISLVFTFQLSQIDKNIFGPKTIEFYLAIFFPSLLFWHFGSTQNDWLNVFAGLEQYERKKNNTWCFDASRFFWRSPFSRHSRHYYSNWSDGNCIDSTLICDNKQILSLVSDLQFTFHTLFC